MFFKKMEKAFFEGDQLLKKINKAVTNFLEV